MANTIILKKSSVATKVPLAADLQIGELAVNLSDQKLYSKNAAGTVVLVGQGVGGSGTVTSVTGTSPVSVATGTTTPVVSLSSGYGDTQNPYASKTANFVLAAPNGAAGVPTFRAIVVADIPTLNQNTTGTASNVTGTVAVANGGTGQTTYTNGQLLIGNSTGNTLAKATLTQGTGISITNGTGVITVANSAPDQTVALTGAGATSITGTYPNFTISSVNTTYGTATSTVSGLIELGSDTVQTVAASAVSATASRSYALQLNASGQGVVNIPWTDTNSGGTVTSVGGTGTVSGLTLTGTVTGSGNLTLGGAISQLNQNTTGNAATATSAGSVTGWNAPPTGNNGGTWPQLVGVKSDGSAEIGRYLDFHGTSNDGVDATVRLDGGGTGSQTLTLTGDFVASKALFSTQVFSSGTNYSAQSNFNTTNTSVTLANTGFIDMVNFSGFVIINNMITGGVSHVLFGGGNVTVTGNTGTGSQMSLSYNAGINGYTIQNFTGGTVTLGIFKVSTRNGA